MNLIRLCVFVFLFITDVRLVEGADLNIHIHDAGVMTIFCWPAKTASHIKSYGKIQISRQVSSESLIAREMASATPTTSNGQAQLVDKSLTTRANVMGRADNANVSGSFIQIVLSQVSCKDSGKYICSVTFLTFSNTSATKTNVKMAIIHTDPGHVSMYISPRMSGNLYSVNESVRFRCSADVGNPPQNRPWSWQWNYLVDTNIWESYPYTNRIKDAPVQPGSCKNYGSSTLTHIVTAKDNGRIIRCVINNNTLYSEKFLFYRKCKSFWYGDDCSKKCNCLKETEVCDTKTGYCKSGCPEDWFGSACDIPCHCSEGCRGRSKGCISCKPGFQGLYCQEDVDECTNQLHSCIEEGEECENNFGSFRCKCRKGYLTKGKGCVRKSQWGSWMEKPDECEKNCTQTVTRYRFCVDPPPVVEGDSCVGEAWSIVTQKCEVGKCDRCPLSQYKKTKGDPICPESCRRDIVIQSRCSDLISSPPEPTVYTINTTEPCVGDYCDECASGQNNCFEKLGHTCEDTQGSFRCVCKNGFSKVPGEDKCLPNAAWSTWVKEYKSGCDASCHRKVQLKRYCTNPPLHKGSKQCLGSGSDMIYENCLDLECKNGIEVNNTNIDRCAARLHNCTKYGQQCENTQQGTVRCTCRQGFTRVKDECHPTAYWSDWQLSYGECETHCLKTKKRRRFCLNPSQLNDGAGYCKGNAETSTLVKCYDGQCKESYWSEWVEVIINKCERSCRRLVVRERDCIIHLTQKKLSQCPGNKTSRIEKSCSDGDCVMDECKQRTNDCYKTEGMECIDKKRSYTCGCRNGYNKVGIKCARNGAWSAWIIDSPPGDCDVANCSRVVEYSRYCTDPPPQAGGRPCSGMSKYYDQSTCVGHSCDILVNRTNQVLAAKVPTRERRSRPYVVGATFVSGIAVAVGATVYYRSKKKGTSGSKSQILLKGDEYFMS